MSLQFADFDADGHEDIVTAVWEGTVFTVPGGPDGFGQPLAVKDGQGGRIVLSRYYDMEKHEYVSADPTQPDEHLVSALAWDWDADGDLDLILGAKDGQVYLRRNEGAAGQAKFATRNEPLQAGDNPFRVPGGSTAPRPVDWDGDGRIDLVCGSFKGGVYWYRNVGEAGAPAFAPPIALLKAGEATADAPRPETGWYAEPVDYDGDGDLDLVVGGQFMLRPKPRTLSAAEEKRLAELDADLARASSEWSKLYGAMTAATKGLDKDAIREARAAFYARDDAKALMKKMADLREQQNELRPRPKRESGVWLYRRRDASDTDGR